ncbi:hypothetical protein [Pedobacter gandavensis]|uniref:hypothetical protein n=1 Tax=Pedobacter gandavensis TaxID=2679963 RepID=UPI00292FB0CF|nr:hypothetical protein [Pedobacter gandavensis]
MSNNKSNNLSTFNFKIHIPLAIETIPIDDAKHVIWGKDNLYPDYLLSLYQKSPIHANIINQKAIHLVGEQLTNKLTNRKFDIKPNASDTIDLFLDKLVKDYLIFNSFAIEVNFNAFNQPIAYNFIPFNKIRLNKSKTTIFYSEDWSKRKDIITYDRYLAGKNYTDGKSRVYLYEGYIPSLNNIYSEPEYTALKKVLATDIAIIDFNLNQIQSHFSVSTLITFFMGEDIDPEIKGSISRKLEESFSGENGRKFMLDFQTPNGKSAEIQNISSGDWNDAFLTIKDATESAIYEGHQITSPALFGAKSAGQLGSSQELENAYEIWSGSYLRTKRNQLESALAELFGVQVEFKHKALFMSQLDLATKEKVYTIDELRSIDGLKPLPDGSGSKLISQMSAGSAPAHFCSHFSKDELVKTELTEEDYDKIKDLGLSSDEFEIVQEFKFSKEDDIATYLIENDVKNLTYEEIVARLAEEDIETDVKELKETLTKLQDSGLIKVTDVAGKENRIKVVPVNAPDIPDSREIQVMYKYEKRKNIEGEILIDTSRQFCRKVVENDKYYSRAEIQSMSDIFGYDIFKFTGGYYTNSTTGEHTPYCRHQWTAYKVARKKGNK